MRRSFRRSGWALVELLLITGWLMAVVGILFVASVHGAYLVRIAAEHTERVAVIDSLKKRIADDVLAARSHRWDSQRATLSLDDTRQDDGHIRYQIGPASVIRTLNGVQTHAWRATRLEFGAKTVSGPRAVLLAIELRELPPPRATELPVRTFTATFVLPPTGERGDAK